MDREAAVRRLRKQAGRVRRRVKRLLRRWDPRRRNQPAKPRWPLVGMVEKFEGKQIVGWVAGDRSRIPARVTLHINDVEIAHTWASDPQSLNTWGDVAGFRFALADMWNFCTRKDRLTVRVDGVPLPISEKGTYRRPGGDGSRSLDELKTLLAGPHMFNQFGQLRLSKKYDTEWQNAVLGLYNRVNAVLQRKFGYDLFAIYGTLLGLVRDGGFIGHDVDFDVAYISQHSDPQLVADELREIAFVLIDAGFDVLCRTTALHIHDEQDPETRIDVFHLFFDADGKLIFPFGKATHIDITKDEWAGLRDVPLGGQSVKLPVLGEAMAECLYGTSWRIPIPGFSWPRVRTGWGAGDLPESYCEEVHWSNFYAHHEMTEPSRFFEFVSAREDMPRTVLDIGCGDGRDSLAFARVSRPVLGIDRSEVGIRHATRRAGEAGLAGVANFAVGDVADEATVRSAVEQAREAGDGSGLLLYLRFVLNVLTEDTQEVLLRTLAATAQPGDVLAAEFRTENDRGTKKVHGRHYRRYQDGPAFAAALQERYGFDVFFEEEGSGFSPYQHEDPVLYRVLARFRETPDLS